VLPCPQVPWGDELKARVLKDRLVTIVGKADVRRRALIELQQAVLTSSRGKDKRLAMLASPGSHTWSQWKEGASRTLHEVFYVYGNVTRGRQPTGELYDTVYPLIIDTLRASERNRMTGRLPPDEGGLLRNFWRAAPGAKLQLAKEIQNWVFLYEPFENDDNTVTRAAKFLGLAYTLGITVGEIYLSFDSLELGSDRQLRSVETLVKHVQSQPDFKAFTIVLGWDGKDSTLYHLSRVTPTLEDILTHNSLSVH
jgi:hypothetical protein